MEKIFRAAQPVTQPVIRAILPIATPELPLMGRLDGPSVAPAAVVAIAHTYREAVRLCWQLRRIKAMTRATLAAESGLYASHVSDYLNTDDKPSRRSLPAESISAFESVCGNSLISQWLASRAHLTVLEELQASKAA